MGAHCSKPSSVVSTAPTPRPGGGGGKAAGGVEKLADTSLEAAATAVPADASCPATTLPTDQPLAAATPACSEGGDDKGAAPEAEPAVKSPRMSAGAPEPAAGAVRLSKSSSGGASAKLPPVRGAAAPTEHSINSNSSVSTEKSGLTTAQDALPDDVSQSVLKAAPDAADSDKPDAVVHVGEHGSLEKVPPAEEAAAEPEAAELEAA